MSNLLGRAVRKSFTALCREANSSLSLKALKMLEDGDYMGLVSMKIEPGDYESPSLYLVDNQVACFFKKYKDFDLGLDLKAEAAELFKANERKCFRSNVRLNRLIDDRDVYGEHVSSLIGKLRKEIGRVLGRCPSIAELNPRFGPGSTFRDVGPLITVPDKMSNDATLTTDLTPCLDVWRETAWCTKALVGELPPTSDCPLDGVSAEDPDPNRLFRYAPRKLEYVDGNRFTTVDKDAKRKRGICIEPSLNLYFQLGVGSWITMRMGKVYGWSKVNVQDLHRHWAMLGSAFGHLATIDLANASDTICTALVKLLLPWDWFDLLDMMRSKTTLIDESRHHLEKFSSMGNGFTFELETLIFRCIAEVLTPRDEISPIFDGNRVSTFGDDIIVPSSVAGNVIAVLEFLGFEINKTKSFVDGPFRESCGGDFFRGYPVRAHYLRESPDEPHQLIALANGLNRFRSRCLRSGCDRGFDRVRLRVLDDLPTPIRALRGPEQLGDLLIHDEESKWEPRVRNSVRYFRVWRPVRFGKTSFDHFRPGVLFAAALYGVPDGTPTSISSLTEDSCKAISGFDTRVNGSFVSGYRMGQVAYS